jgi:ABC-type transport system involved in multi-copper enzyme maturation permease subunit
MRNIFGIARYTFIEIFRNKVYYVLLLFAGVLILSTLLLGSLGGEQRSRMIVDMGLGSIEIFALAISVFAAVTLVLEEMESRTLYLVLTRPVARQHFVLGRFFGLIALISAAYVLMAFAHIVLCKASGIVLDHHYALALYGSWEKIVLITSVAMFFSLFATSTISAVTFTFFFWVMGHFSQELRFLAHKSSQPVVLALCSVFSYIAPNFELMNLRDMPPAHSYAWLWPAAGYGFCYTTVALLLTILLFRRKEF